MLSRDVVLHSDLEAIEEWNTIYDDEDDYENNYEDEDDRWGDNREDCCVRPPEWLEGVRVDIQEAYLKRFWAYVWENKEDGLLYYTECVGDWDEWVLDKKLDRDTIDHLMEVSVANDEDWLYQRTNSPYKEKSRW